jgi:hypothetical protein
METDPLMLIKEARRLVREFLYLVDENFGRMPEAGEIFLKILVHPHAYDALEQMMETGLLGAFIPEFGAVQYRVQFDAYHMLPVGRHLFFRPRPTPGVTARCSIFFAPAAFRMNWNRIRHGKGLKGTSRPARVVLDNRQSDFFTILEVFADDKPHPGGQDSHPRGPDSGYFLCAKSMEAKWKTLPETDTEPDPDAQF